MPSESIFTKIRLGIIPGEIVFENNTVFVIMTITPHNPGHCLVIPVKQSADLLQCDLTTREELFRIAHHMMKIESEIYKSPRVALVAAGLEVDHTHLHVFPIYQNADLDPGQAKTVDFSLIQKEANKLRQQLIQDPIL